VTPSPLFNFNAVLQTRLLSLQTTNLHFLIITNKRYNFCPCLSLWTRLSNFNFCMLQHLCFQTTAFISFAFAFNSYHSRFMFLFGSTFGTLDFCFGFLSLSTFRLFPFDFTSLSGFSSHAAYSASHFFRPLIFF
jgi:hypothetical protein